MWDLTVGNQGKQQRRSLHLNTDQTVRGWGGVFRSYTSGVTGDCRDVNANRGGLLSPPPTPHGTFCIILLLVNSRAFRGCDFLSWALQDSGCKVTRGYKLWPNASDLSCRIHELLDGRRPWASHAGIQPHDVNVLYDSRCHLVSRLSPCVPTHRSGERQYIVSWDPGVGAKSPIGVYCLFNWLQKVSNCMKCRDRRVQGDWSPVESEVLKWRSASLWMKMIWVVLILTM